MKFKKNILLIAKYLFIVSILGFILLFIFLSVYSKRFAYSIPEVMNIELYDNQGNKFLSLSNGNKQSYITLDQISPYLIDAFISIEDKKFFNHQGIDLLRIGGALLANIKAGEITQGASTITQQYARNLFLTQDKNIKRKIDEIFIAINLENKYSKEEILEGYLNSIYFDHGIYGVEDASLFYFNKHAKDLSLAEAAMIAAIPKGPGYYSPIKNYENNKRRKELIIKELLKDKKITIEEANQALQEEPKLYGIPPQTNEYNAPYFQDLIMEEIKKILVITPAKRQSYKVYTTLDISLNKTLEECIEKYYPYNSEIEIAVYAINPQNGHVLSVIGGKDYQKSQFNRATKALRQPGSTIKPFLYYAALEHGFTPATTFLSAPSTFYINGISYSPNNYANIYPNQDISMAYALATSDNIYAVKTHLFLGNGIFAKTLRDFKFTTKINDNPSLALGTSEVYLSELVNAYAHLASLGKEVTPTLITKITDMNDKVLYQAKNNTQRQLFDKANTYILNETMTNVFDNRLAININVTGAPIANMLTRKYAAKSGSTDFDNWIVGYNKDIVLGIWTGYDDSREIIRSDEQKYIKYIWAEAIEAYMKNCGNGWYEMPSNVTAIALNPISGNLTGPNNFTKLMYFKKDNLPWHLLNNNKTNQD